MEKMKNHFEFWVLVGYVCFLNYGIYITNQGVGEFITTNLIGIVLPIYTSWKLCEKMKEDK